MKKTVETSQSSHESYFQANPHSQNRLRRQAFFQMPGVLNGTIRIETPEGTYEKDFDKRTPATLTPKGPDLNR